MNKLIVIFLAVCLYSCGSKSTKESKVDSVAASVKKGVEKLIPPSKYELQTKSGKSLTLVESHPAGMSLSEISIVPSGFEKKDSIKIKEADPIRSQTGTELGDLDNDGFEELYVYTESAGSGSYGGVYAFASLKDKELKAVDCSALAADSKGLEAQGYRGHDSFKIEGHSLVRTFPIYKEADSNAAPSGGEKSVRYKLKDMKLVSDKI